MKKFILYSMSILLIILLLFCLCFGIQSKFNNELLYFDDVEITIDYGGFVSEQEYREVNSMLYTIRSVPENYKNIIKVNVSINNESDKTVTCGVMNVENKYFYINEESIILEPWCPISPHSREDTTMYIFTVLSNDNVDTFNLLKNCNFEFYLKQADDYDNQGVTINGKFCD